MDRKEEWNDLMVEVQCLDYQCEKSVRRAKRRRWRNRIAAGFGTAAGVLCVLFVLMVNASISFAMSCAESDVMKELACAVAFSEELRSVIRADAVQKPALKEKKDGITVSVDYVIAEEEEVRIYFKGSWNGDVSWNNTRLHGYNRETQDTFYVQWTEKKDQTFFRSYRCITVKKSKKMTDNTSIGLTLDLLKEGETVAFYFQIPIDTANNAEIIRIPIDETITVDNTTIQVKELRVSPSGGELLFEQQEDSYYRLRQLNIWLRTDRGELCYKPDYLAEKEDPTMVETEEGWHRDASEEEFLKRSSARPLQAVQFDNPYLYLADTVSLTIRELGLDHYEGPAVIDFQTQEFDPGEIAGLECLGIERKNDLWKITMEWTQDYNKKGDFVWFPEPVLYTEAGTRISTKISYGWHEGEGNKVITRYELYIWNSDAMKPIHAYFSKQIQNRELREFEISIPKEEQ